MHDDAPILDTARLLALGESEGPAANSIRRMIADLLSRGRAPLNGIADAMAAQDWDAAAARLHAWRGSVSTLGATRLGHVIAEIERLLREGDKAQARRDLDQIEPVLEQTDQAFLAWSECYPPQITGTGADVSSTDIARLSELLAAGDFDAVELFERISAGLMARLGEKGFAQLAQCMSALQFAQARRLLPQAEPAACASNAPSKHGST